MPPLIDLTGQKIGRWTVLEKAPSKNRTVYKYLQINNLKLIISNKCFHDFFSC